MTRRRRRRKKKEKNNKKEEDDEEEKEKKKKKGKKKPVVFNNTTFKLFVNYYDIWKNMINIWITKDKIKQIQILKIYESIIMPILLYDSGTWSPTKKEEEQLDAFHRKQLRKLMKVK